MILAISFAGGIISLDRIYAQTLLSRPVVTASIIGLILNDFRTGLMIGAVLELLWIDQSPIGTAVPPNDTVSAVVISACALLAGRQTGDLSRELITLSILLLLPVAILAQRLEIYIFRRNDSLSRIALSHAMRGDIRRVAITHVIALFKTFVLITILITAAMLAGFHLIVFIYPLLPGAVMKVLNYTYYFIPILGVAVALNTIHLKRMLPVFCGIFLVISLILDLYKLF